MEKFSFTSSLLDQDDQCVQQALDVLQGELGGNYISREFFETYLSRNEHFSGKIALIAKNVETYRIVGTLIAEIVTPETFEASFLDAYASVLKYPAIQPLRFHRTGLIKSVAVPSQFQRQGIGTSLVSDALKKLSAYGAEHFYALGWVSKKGCHIQNTLESLGFKYIDQLEQFWFKDSLEHKYSCPSCGNPCVCSARLFIK